MASRIDTIKRRIDSISRASGSMAAKIESMGRWIDLLIDGSTTLSG